MKEDRTWLERNAHFWQRQASNKYAAARWYRQDPAMAARMQTIARVFADEAMTQLNKLLEG